MEWKPFKDPSGRFFSLSHLHPLRYSVKFEASTKYSAVEVDVHVGFSMHTFTRAGVAGDDENLAYADDRERRIFDAERYRYSKLLPAIVKELGKRKCYHARQQNFFTAEVPDNVPQGSEYLVFFLVSAWPEETRRTGKPCVRLIIQSAYLVAPGNPMPRGRREQPIGFRVLISRALGLAAPPKKRKPHAR